MHIDQSSGVLWLYGIVGGVWLFWSLFFTITESRGYVWETIRQTVSDFFSSSYEEFHYNRLIAAFTGAVLFFLVSSDIYEVIERPGPGTWEKVVLAVTFFVVLASVIRMVRRGEEKPFIGLTAICLLISTGAFGFGLFTTLNGALDQNPPVTRRLRIADKRISSGKSTSYYFHFKDWKNPGQEATMRVNSKHYRKHEIGDIITVITKDGRLGREWVRDIEWSKSRRGR